MTPISIEVNIPQEVYDVADRYFGDKAESDEVRWQNFACHCIPIKSQEESKLKELAGQHPLRFMLASTLMDARGLLYHTLLHTEAGPEGQLMLYMAQKLNSQTNILAIAINSLFATGALTSNKVMKLLITPSPIFEENRYGIIRDAVELFIQGKYVLFSHLIVSQIESAIRNPVEMSDAPILKSQQVGRGYQLKTLDELLREKCISEIFTFDGALYM